MRRRDDQDTRTVDIINADGCAGIEFPTRATRSESHESSLYFHLDPALADEWFRLMSERMDELKKIEDSVEGCFHARCTERFADARNSLAHQETLITSLDAQEPASQPMLVLCDSGNEQQAGESWASDGIGQQFGRSIFDLVQEQTRRLQQMTDELQSAREALEDRKTQEKAVLLLMEHRRISNDEAHEIFEGTARRFYGINEK